MITGSCYWDAGPVYMLLRQQGNKNVLTTEIAPQEGIFPPFEGYFSPLITSGKIHGIFFTSSYY
jgi:hypothetical protein